MIRRAVRLVAAALVAAAAGVGVPALLIVAAPPAAAAVCGGSTGVTVIVDFNQLATGPAVQGSCVSDGGGDRAQDLFPAAQFPLNYVRGSGFVCQVSGVPDIRSCNSTPPADAYWGLWWSDGGAGSTWTYSSLGVGSLKIPDGGLVAFAWDEVDGTERPTASASRPTAPPATSQPSATPAPTRTPSQGPGPSDPSSPASPSSTPTRQPPVTQEPSMSASAFPTASPTVSASGVPEATTSPTTSASPTDAGVPGEPVPTDPPVADPVDPASSAATPAGDGLPAWVAPGVIVVLLGAAGAVLALRRRQTGP